MEFQVGGEEYKVQRVTGGGNNMRGGQDSVWRESGESC